MLNQFENSDKVKTSTLELGTIFFINLSLLIVSFIYFSSLDETVNLKETLNLITYIGLVVFLWIIISWFWITKSVINVYMIFIVFSVFFYLGQPIVITFGGNITDYNVYHITKFSYEIINITLIFVIKAYLLFHFGATLICFKNRVKKTKSSIYVDYSSSMVLVGKILFIISIIPTIIVLINSIYAVSLYGYIGLFMVNNTVSSGGVLVVISGFFIPAMYMLIIGNSENSKKRTIWILVFLSYLILVFLLGKRGSNTLQLLGLILIWHYSVNRFKINQIIKLCVLGIPFVFIMSLLSTIRSQLEHRNITESIMQLIHNNFVFSILSETGSTLIVPSTVIANTPINISFYNGRTYWDFFLNLIPNWFWEVNPGLINGTLETKFTPLVSNQSIGGFGGSYLAEIYYNFGNFGLVFVPILGYLLAVLFYKTEQASLKKNKLLLFSCIYATQIILWYVRSETLLTGKEYLYYIFFPVLLVIVIKDYSNKIKYKYET